MGYHILLKHRGIEIAGQLEEANLVVDDKKSLKEESTI
jgi:hypothetical protein